ncbi:MAG: spermidine/putrescine ABC transporter permease PotC [Deferribacteraceae bacterium]|jgi:spermidine/putrescine transport system permease protein|nr:spermidine/putrescine ABC transporter permease PotC [Deferribacteraceae bacterium]
MKAVKFTYFWLVFLFLYMPILLLIIFSFNSASYSASLWEGFSLKWYIALFSNHQLLDAALNSLILAVSAASLATALGALTAISLYRFKFPGKGYSFAMLYIVMMSPDIIMGISLLVLFITIKIPLGFITLLITHVTFSLPFVVVTVLARLSGFDKHIVEASKDLGADEAAAFRYVIFPLLIPAVAAGWLLSFTLSMDDVIGSFFVTDSTYQILPLRIYAMVRLGVKPEINALSAILFVISLVLVVIFQLLLRKKESTALKNR